MSFYGIRLRPIAGGVTKSKNGISSSMSEKPPPPPNEDGGGGKSRGDGFAAGEQALSCRAWRCGRDDSKSYEFEERCSPLARPPSICI